jgi:hypothetical protein
MPLAQIKDIVSAQPAAAAQVVRSYWSAAECEPADRRQLAAYLVDQLTGKRPVMYEAAVRDIPARSMLCLLRTAADQSAVTALGKEFIGIVRRSPLPAIDGAAGAAFLIYHGEVSADSDGPVEWCKPVPADQADELAAQKPELTLRTEPGHQEAYVHLGRGQVAAPQWQLAAQSLQDWAATEHRLPSELGARMTFLASRPVTAGSAPDCDLAIPCGTSRAAHR